MSVISGGKNSLQLKLLNVLYIVAYRCIHSMYNYFKIIYLNFFLKTFLVFSRGAEPKLMFSTLNYVMCTVCNFIRLFEKISFQDCFELLNS